MMISEIPDDLNHSTVRSRIGLPRTGTMHLGIRSVRGLSRVPKPAARIIAFTRSLPACEAQHL